MISRYPIISGILLIFIGFAILFREYYELDFYFFRSYGLFLLGLFGLLKGLSAFPRRGIYLPFLLMLVGLYYIGGDLGLYYIDRGLTVSVFIILSGVSFYPLYIFAAQKWNYLLYGNLILLTGLLFLAYYLDFISPHLFRTIVEDYWPVALIIIGFGYLIHAFLQNGNHRISHSSR
jgi:hypothetical protein